MSRRRSIESITMMSDDEDDDDHQSRTNGGDDGPDEYTVEKVLAERIDPEDGRIKYLVKWENYDIPFCTWEPEEHFFDPATLKNWKEHKRVTPKEKLFDWRAWEIEKEAREKLEAEQAIEIDEDEDLDEDDDDDSEERRKYHRIQRRRKSSTGRQTDNDDNGSDSSKRRRRRKERGERQSSTGSPKHKRRRTSFIKSDDESDSPSVNSTGSASSGVTTDSFAEELAEKATRPKIKKSEKRKQKKKDREKRKAMQNEDAKRLQKGEKLTVHFTDKQARAPSDSIPRVPSGNQNSMSTKVGEKRRRLSEGSSGAADNIKNSGEVKSYQAKSNKPVKQSTVKRPRLSPQPQPLPIQLPKIEKKTAAQKAASGHNMGLPKSKPWTLQQINRANKGTHDRAPDPSSLVLFAPGTTPTERRRESVVASDNSGWHVNKVIPDQAAVVNTPVSSILNNIDNSTMSLNDGASRPSGTSREQQKESFNCSLTWGTNETKIRNLNASFVGFSKEFVAFLSKIQIKELHVSKYLGMHYLDRYFKPELGLPLEWAELELKLDQDSHFATTLAVIRGAAVILRKEFCMIVFQSTIARFREIFKLPVSQSSYKYSFRAVVYKPLDLSPQRLESPSQQIQSALKKKYDAEQDMKPAISLDDVLKRLKRMDLGFHRTTTKESKFVFIDPTETAAETEDLRSIIGQRSRSWSDQVKAATNPQTKSSTSESFEIPYDDIVSGAVDVKTQKQLQVMVHTSLRTTMHLLPKFEVLKTAKPNHMFYMYGTEIDIAGKQMSWQPYRIFPHGGILFLPLHVMYKDTERLGQIMEYMIKKSATWKVAIASDLLEVMEKILEKTNRDSNSVAQWVNVFMKLHTLNASDSLIKFDISSEPFHHETVMDMLAHFQSENCRDYRRFIVLRHEKDVKSQTLKFYSNMENITAEAFIVEFIKRDK